MIPAEIPNLIDGASVPPSSGEWLDKLQPADGTLLCRVARSAADDIAAAVIAARAAQPAWAERTAVERGDLVRELALRLRDRREEASEIVAAETGKAIELARVLNVVQGTGPEAGAPLAAHPDVDLVSFTGSAATGRWINETAGRRLAKVCLELGGKNALVVCDDADLSNAVRWALASAFSNAGQRCASASRLVVFDGVYEAFRERLVEQARALVAEPVVSEASLDRILAAIRRAVVDGATVLSGGERLDNPGWYLAPTVIEGATPDSEVSRTELFGPVTLLYRVRDLEEAIGLVNESPYGLTSSIHTASLHRAMRFADKVQAGVVVVNAGTHGSEPHMGFGGLKQSGTGWREAGVEALDVYSDWKVVNLIADPALT